MAEINCSEKIFEECVTRVMNNWYFLNRKCFLIEQYFIEIHIFILDHSFFRLQHSCVIRGNCQL